MAETPSPTRTETQSIESDAAVTTVVDLLADPTHLLKWAPTFADSISGDTASGWRATKDGRDFSLRVLSTTKQGPWTTCGRSLRAVRGAYIRVIPRPRGGSVIGMTLPLLPDVDPADTATTLGRELTALVSLTEER